MWTAKVGRSITNSVIILVANPCDGRRIRVYICSFRVQRFRPRVRNKELRPVTETSGQTCLEPVVPHRPLTLNLLQTRSGQTLKRNPLLDVCNRVSGHAANWIGSACQQSLIDRDKPEQICTARSNIAEFQQVVPGKLG